jgi:hypothetical protein
VKSAHSQKPSKTEALLVSLAESVGSTLGTLAAKAGSAQKALSRSDVTGRLERGGKKIVRRSKKLMSTAMAKTKKTNKKARRPRVTRRIVKRAATRRANAVARNARATVRRGGTTVRRAAARRSKETRTRSKS